MASINQLVSEFAHSLGQPNNYALRENIRSLIAHTRAEVIRRSYENHNYVDKVLTQRYKVSLVDVTDGEIPSEYVSEIIDVPGREEEVDVVVTPERSINIANKIFAKFRFPSLSDAASITAINLFSDNLMSFISPRIPKVNTMYIKLPVEYDTSTNMDIKCLMIGVGGNSSCQESDTEGYYYLIIPRVSKEARFKISIETNGNPPAFAVREVVSVQEGGHVITGDPIDMYEDFPTNYSKYYFLTTQSPDSNFRMFTITGPELPANYITIESLDSPYNGKLIYQSEVTTKQTIIIPPTTKEVYATIDGIARIKKTAQKLPKPIRLTNNLPFDRVSSVGYLTNREYPYIKETTARFRANLPGMVGMPCYDYINGYIYMFPAPGRSFDAKKIIIEGAFEDPTAIQIANGEVDALDNELYYNNEYVLSEDMIGQIKDIIYKRDLLNTVRQTNEIPNEIKYN